MDRSGRIKNISYNFASLQCYWELGQLKDSPHGPSNGGEMLLFFEDALTIENPDGSVILERGDTVVMDNCGFHHSHFAEGMLRDMFHEFGIELLYQPPYCPHFNKKIKQNNKIFLVCLQQAICSQGLRLVFDCHMEQIPNTLEQIPC